MSDQKTYRNRKAFFDYFVEEELEAGIKLEGAEVKAIRSGGVDLTGSFARMDGGECYAYGIKLQYDKSRDEADPARPRKLLLHKDQIVSLGQKASGKGHTLIPLELYFKGPWVKVKLGLCTGKKQHDKRADLKDKAERMDELRGD